MIVTGTSRFAAGGSMHWVVIQTGGTQRYLFDSNKRKLNVGASYLVTKLPEWVSEAIGEIEGVTEENIVVNVSGVANLLVDDEETGRAIVAAVTRRALDEAPGLQVWGCVGPAISGALGPALRETYDLAELIRSTTPGSVERFPATPFTARSPLDSLPVTEQRKLAADDSIALSKVAAEKWDSASVGLATIKEKVTDSSSAIMKVDNDDDHETWTSIVHIDGNGFGQLLIQLTDEESDDFEVRLKDLSNALEAIGWEALNTAIDHLHRSDDKPWILPLVVGGDDLTAIVSAPRARAFALAYLKAFEDKTRAKEIVSDAAQGVLGRPYLTAAAGIAIVKPTHPFHTAYRRAEELCRSAKNAKTTAPESSALDIQVFHESVGRSLDDVRSDLQGSEDPLTQLWPGELLTSHTGVGGLGSAARLDEVVSELRQGVLTSSEWHGLRTALTDRDADAWRRSVEGLKAQLAVFDPGRLKSAAALLDDETIPYLLPAMDLLDVEDAR
ncbi:MAG: hypothetical protein QM621_11085 [Aeromicrobium sp.]|uniref:Cas10/Cmr2 second palm domain-containing protein n=1 Tax=Aeromicrobium sp. TaxID=1871063 RepID=UPI0039E4B2D7